MGKSCTQVSGGGSTTSIADLPADWRQQMDDETRALLELDNTGEMKDDEFTAKDAMEVLKVSSLPAANYRLKKHVKEGAVTVRKAYDPRIGRQVNAYRRV